VARSRFYRRRRTLLATMVILVGLGGVFVRDLVRAGHESTSAEQSVGYSFSALARGVQAQSDQMMADTQDLVVGGSHWNRGAMKSRLVALGAVSASLIARANQLSKPNVSTLLQNSFVAFIVARSKAVQVVVHEVSGHLDFATDGAETDVPSNLEAAKKSLGAASDAWRRSELRLSRQPGHPRLPPAARVWNKVTPEALVQLLTTPSLQPRGGVWISAVGVLPAALPSSSGTLLLLPAAPLGLSFSITNTRDVQEKVWFDVSMTAQGVGAPGSHFSGTVEVAANASTAITVPNVTTVVGERGHLQIQLRGQLDPSKSSTRSFAVVVTADGKSTPAALG